MKIHKAKPNTELTLCNLIVYGLRLTEDESEVTCKLCLYELSKK